MHPRLPSNNADLLLWYGVLALAFPGALLILFLTGLECESGPCGDNLGALDTVIWAAGFVATACVALRRSPAPAAARRDRPVRGPRGARRGRAHDLSSAQASPSLRSLWMAVRAWMSVWSCGRFAARFIASRCSIEAMRISRPSKLIESAFAFSAA